MSTIGIMFCLAGYIGYQASHNGNPFRHKLNAGEKFFSGIVLFGLALFVYGIV